MFERDKYGAPLVAHIAGGVAIGVIIGGVVLYGLWSIHVNIQMARAAKEFESAMKAVQQQTYRARVAGPVPQPTRPAAPSGPCMPGDSPGVLNGEAVCVSKYGQVTPIRR